MITVSKYDCLRVPEWALPYLVNGDASGLDMSNLELVDEWFARFQHEARSVGGTVIFSPGDGEAGFTHRPEFGLSCNCSDCTVLIVKGGAE